MTDEFVIEIYSKQKGEWIYYDTIKGLNKAVSRYRSILLMDIFGQYRLTSSAF